MARRRPSGRRAADKLFSMDPYLLAHVDPFHADAAGARVPDDSTYPAVAYTALSRVSITTDVNGNAAVLVTPEPKQVFLAPSAVAAGPTITWTSPTATSMTNYNSINQNFTLYRHAGWGVRVVNPTSLLNSAGTLYICYVPNFFKNLTTPIQSLPTTPDQILSMPWSTAIPITEINDDSFIFPAKRIDPSTYRFRDITMPISNVNQLESSDGWGSFVFCVAGASTTNATTLIVEVVNRMELIPAGTSSLFGTGTTHGPNRQLMDTVTSVSAGLPVAYKDDQPPGFLHSMVAEAVSQISSVWNANRGPLGRYLGAGAAQTGLRLAANFVGTYSRNRRRIQ